MKSRVIYSVTRVLSLITLLLLALPIAHAKPIDQAGSNLRCSAAGQCVIGGSGRQCAGDSDCRALRCDWGQCVLGGRGTLCNENADCGQKRCAETKCMPGGSGVPCSGDSECLLKRCGLSGTCSLNNKFGPPCGSDWDCRFTKSCSRDGTKCTASGDGLTACRTDTDCLEMRHCYQDKTCRVGDPGNLELARLCNSDSDCNVEQKYCEFGSCKAGGIENRSCDLDRECDGRKECAGLSCLSTLERGINGCSDDADCIPHDNPDDSFAGIISTEISSYDIRQYLGWMARLGPNDADLGILVFMDLRCGMCAKFYRETLSRLLTDYVDRGLAKLEFVETPLVSADAPYHLAAKCADEQGKYREYIAQALSKDSVKKSPTQIAGDIALDSQGFNACLQDSSTNEAIVNHRSISQSLGVDGTPVTIISRGGRAVRIDGSQPYEVLERAIESLDRTSDKELAASALRR